jgi:glycosyltransferase involved in cell wall biosynthesis
MIAYTLYDLDARVRRAAEALAESGHHVDVFTLPCPGVSANNDNPLIRIHLLRMHKQKGATTSRYAVEWGVFFAWTFARISLLHARRRYDVVYVHNMPNFLVFAGVLPKLSGARIVLDVHDPAAELMAAIAGRDLPGWLRWLVSAEERVSLSFSDAVITVNEAMRRRLSAVSRRPVTVIMNLPDQAVFVPAAAPQGAGTGAESLDWLVYTGTVADRHGLDLVIRALQMLAAEFPALRFRLVGDGPALPSVIALADELGVADRVEFRAFVSNDEIPAVVNDAAAGVSPQRDDRFGSLVFSMKVAEYVALGLPVICSGIATMRYYFDDDELLFFEPGNVHDLAGAIRDLLTHPEAAQQRAAKSRIKLNKLDWPAQKETLVATVEALPGSRRE